MDPDEPDALQFLPSSSSCDANAPADASAQQSHYRFGPKNMTWYFCKTCGVTTLTQGEYQTDAAGAGNGKTLCKKARMLNAVTLDQGQNGLDLSKIRFRYFNGRDHGWSASLQDAPAAWGTW